MESVLPSDKDFAVNTVSFMFVSISDGISEVIGGRAENTLRMENVPAVLPNQLAKMRPIVRPETC